MVFGGTLNLPYLHIASILISSNFPFHQHLCLSQVLISEQPAAGPDLGTGPYEKLLLLLLSRLSHVRLLVTPWTAAHQAPPSMGFSRQEYWSGVPLPSPLQCT